MAPELVDLYITAMKYPRSMRDQRIAVWRREITMPGFTAVAAFQQKESDTASLAGIAYGFIGNPDRWWDQQLRKGLVERHAMTPAMVDVVSNYFEVAEVHVSPELQGRGAGRELMQRLLGSAPTRYVLLSTPEVPNEQNAAFGLYRSLGFRDVLRDFTYAGDPRPFAVLGRQLPLEPASGGNGQL